MQSGTPATLICLETASELMQLSRRGPGFLDGVIERFEASLAERIADLEAAAQAGDAQRLRDLAHTLKGSAGTLGLLAVGTLASELEQSADATRADTLVRSLGPTTRDSLVALRQLLSRGS